MQGEPVDRWAISVYNMRNIFFKKGRPMEDTESDESPSNAVIQRKRLYWLRA